MKLVTPSEQQTEAILAIKHWFEEVSAIQGGTQNFFYLGGVAGSGKSSILPLILESVGLNIDQVAFCAPTGKAAKVMGEKLKAFGIDRVPRTIHSLIYRPKGLRVDILMADLLGLQGQVSKLEKEIQVSGQTPTLIEELTRVQQTIHIVETDIDRALDRTDADKPLFQLNPDSDIRAAKLVIVDEASMVGAMITDDILSFKIPLLAIGDPCQLPPVMDDPGLTAGTPDFFLTEIHRQARDNPIILLSERAREGKTLKVGNYGDGVKIVERKDDDVTYDPDFEGQIIVGTNKKRWMVTRKLRGKLGITDTGPIAGEPLIVCKNSKTKPLVNGSFIRPINDVGNLIKGQTHFTMKVKDELDNEFEIDCYQGLFEEHYAMEKGFTTASKREAYFARMKTEQVDFGLVITCHKAQGSQWDDVVVHDESEKFREDAHKWLYTAITRAAKKLTVVA